MKEPIRTFIAIELDNALRRALGNVQAQLQQQGLALSTLMAEPSFNSYAFTNLVIPLLTGLALFAILQGVSIGLNVLLEIDFNIREPKN